MPRTSKTARLLAHLVDAGFDRSTAIGRDDYGQFKAGCRIKCSQCEALVINGVPAHERNCPNIVREDHDGTED